MDSTNSFFTKTMDRTNFYWLSKLDSKKLYNMQLLANFLKPTSQTYFEQIFAGHVFKWTKIYILPKIVTTDLGIWVFQYKFLHNVLYLSKKLFQFNKISSPECFFANLEKKKELLICFIFVEKHKCYGRN